MEFKPIHFILIALIMVVLGVDGYLLSRAVVMTQKAKEAKQTAALSRAEQILASLPSPTPVPSIKPQADEPQADKPQAENAEAPLPQAAQETPEPEFAIDEVAALLGGAAQTPKVSVSPQPVPAPEKESASKPRPSQKPKATAKPKATVKPQATQKPTPVPAANSRAVKMYQSILKDYSAQIKKTAPGLTAEFKAEAADLGEDSGALADLMYEKMSALSDVLTEGLAEMSAVIAEPDSGDYNAYEDWSAKLTAVYQSESKKITDAYNSLSKQ